MKAVWNDHIIAEAPRESLIYIEGNWYFPPESVRPEYLHGSDTPYVCPWKGACQYFNVGIGAVSSPDNAWSYPHPLPSATERMHKDFSNYVAFWRDVVVT